MKKRTVSQIADFFQQMFLLRFEASGSIYLDSSNTKTIAFKVGPIIASPFFCPVGGTRRGSWSKVEYYKGLQKLRGPFRTVTDYLQSFVRAELLFLHHYRHMALEEVGERSDLDAAAKEAEIDTIEKLLYEVNELCSVYPGDNPVLSGTGLQKLQFSFKLDDFRLSNIMVGTSSHTSVLHAYVSIDR